MKKKSLNIIFDFDGTLADSFAIVIQKLIPLADQYNFRKINQNEIDGLKDLTSREVIKYLKIPFYRLPAVLRHARECMRNETSLISSFKNLPEILKEIHPDCSLGILTSNSSENVVSWLEGHKIRHLFDFIHTESSYFGKKHLLKKLIKSYKMELFQTFYVGDETRDIDAARKCNINSIAVSWGFNSEVTLLKNKPDYIARTPNDLLIIIKQQSLAYKIDINTV
jgi:phosphoglycolate phosphatase